MATIKTCTRNDEYTITIPDAVYERIRGYLNDVYYQCECIDEYLKDECYQVIIRFRARIIACIFTLSDLKIITTDEACALVDHYSYFITKAYKEAVAML